MTPEVIPPVSDETLAELLELLSRATPGPCEVRYVRDAMPVDCVHFGVVSESAGYETGRNWKREDAELDAKSRNSLRSIVRELQKRRELQGELLAALKSAEGWVDFLIKGGCDGGAVITSRKQIQAAISRADRASR